MAKYRVTIRRYYTVISDAVVEVEESGAKRAGKKALEHISELEFEVVQPETDVKYEVVKEERVK